jgi:dihydroflavonol-4-reductase
MNILVTGANGFLGSHVVKKLVEEGHQVRAMVHNGNDNLSFFKGQTIKADLLHYNTLLKAADGMDCIVHVAGAMSARPRDKKRLFAVNVDGVKNIIRVSIEKKCKLIHISSCVAVGANRNPNDEFLTENSENVTIGKGFANYDSKRMGEELVLSAAMNDEIIGCVLNPGLIYGAGDAKKAIRKSNVKAARGKLPFYIEGGVNIVHVDDVVSAIAASLDHGQNGERYLLTGDNITVFELLSALSNAAGAKAPTIKLPSLFLKVLAFMHDLLGMRGQLSRENIFSATSYHWYEHSKASRDLQFHPRPYQIAINDSVRWMKENHYLN